MNICSNDDTYLQKSYHNFMGILVFLENNLGDANVVFSQQYAITSHKERNLQGIHWGQRNTDIGFITLQNPIHCTNMELNCGSYARNQMS